MNTTMIITHNTTLHMLLGKLLYLEVHLLNPPDPTAMLLVLYCVSYPRSAKSAWILIYDGYEMVLCVCLFPFCILSLN